MGRIFLLFVTFWINVSCERNETLAEYLSENTRLVSDLLANYQRWVAPVSIAARWDNRSQQKMAIISTMIYAKLLSLNESDSTAFSYTTAMSQWTDVRLQWDPIKYNDIQMVLINQEKLWMPDMAPENSVEINQLRSTEVNTVVVYYNGTCITSQTGLMKILCQFNLKDFPFDTQSCSLRMRSMNYLDSEITIDANMNIPDWSDVSDGAWKFKDVNLSKDIYFDAKTGYEYPRVVVHMSMKRSSTYYVVLIIIPSFILTILTVLSMFWGPISYKTYIRTISLGFSSQLSQLSLLQIGSQRIPKSGVLPALSKFILWNICILASCIFSILFTSWLVHKFPVTDGDLWIHRTKRSFYHCAHVFFMLIFAISTLVNFLQLVTCGQK